MPPANVTERVAGFPRVAWRYRDIFCRGIAGCPHHRTMSRCLYVAWYGRKQVYLCLLLSFHR